MEDAVAQQETSPAGQSTTAPGPVAWPTFLLAAVASVLTSPVTAIWLLLLAPVVVLVGAWRVRSGSDHRPANVLSAGLGLLVGPVLYVGVGLATTVGG